MNRRNFLYNSAGLTALLVNPGIYRVIASAGKKKSYSFRTDLDIGTSTLRMDPHPVWSGDYQRVCLNGAPEEKRQVFVADLESIVS